LSNNNTRYTLALPCLLLSSAFILSACSSNPSAWDEENAAAEQPAEPVAAASTTPLEPVEPAEPTQITAQDTAAPAAESVASVQEPAPAHDIRIKADYPREYTVKKGDTLWGIASQYLDDPWYWPEIWYRNEQVKNPHLIYPGDVLTLIFIKGQPSIQVTRSEMAAPTAESTATAGAATDTAAPSEKQAIRTETGTATSDGRKVVKLSPSVHRTDRSIAIPSIPSDAIRQFLINPKIITKNELENAPYIVASDEAHLVLATNNRVYVRGTLDPDRVRYSVFRKGSALVDPDTDDVIGYEIIHAGEARIDVYGDPASATLINTTREILVGDFLLDTDKSEFNHTYYPKVPDKEIDGRIIELFDAISGSGKYQVVAINKGEADGLEIGNVLATYYRGGEQRDKYMARKTFRRGEEQKLTVELPNERSGLVLIFKTFENASYGLILESKRVIRKNDLVATPK
jgi:LysM repeat protein